MRQQDFQRLLAKFSNGECSKEEEEFVMQWYENIQHAGHLLKSEEEETLEAKAWKNLEPIEVKKKSTYVLYAKVAAAVVLIMSVVATGLMTNLFDDVSAPTSKVKAKESDQLITITNPNQKPFTLNLDDGSEIILQPNSELRYPKTFGVQREVFLSGEALFKVKRDTLHPFLVYSNEVVTRVLGTSFTIKAYKTEKEITVSVKSGKVSVYTLKENDKQIIESKESQGLILIPNQEAVYQRESQSVEKRLVENPEIILPKPTLFNMQYDGAPAVKIFEVMEENYGVDIVFDEKQLSECTLTTSLTDEGLYERIQIICKAIGASYEIKDATIYITSKGCQ